MSQYFSLKTELSEIREKSSVMGGRYKHNQQLQELRSLEERLGQEKKQWQVRFELMILPSSYDQV